MARENGLNFVAFSGGAIETTETVAGQIRPVKSRGCVVNGTVYVRTDDRTFTAEQIARHEAAHEQIARGEISTEEVKEKLLEDYSEAEIDAIIDLYAQAYGDSGLTAEEVFEEIICDAMGKMNAFATGATERMTGEVGVFLRNVRKNTTRKEGGQKKNATGDRGGKSSIEFDKQGKTQAEITGKYRADVDKVLNMQNTAADHLVIGYTPEIYQKLGMPALPFVIGTGHVYSTAKTEMEARQDNNFHRGVNYHGLGANTVKDLYSKIKDPVMVIASKENNRKRAPMRSTHSVVAIIDLGTDEKSLLVPVEITAERTVNGIQMDVNAISSAYEKTVKNLVTEAIAQENIGEVGVYYAKKEAMTLPVAGVQYPVRLQQSMASNGIVHRFSEKVNMGIENVTQSQQFKRWFGDWQNNPANASKVVNGDGTPRVVYHGIDADFTVFQSDDGLYWFSESEDYAEEMAHERDGETVMPVYLSIKNPYIAKLPPSQFSNPNYEAGIIRKAKAGNHDGIIIECETEEELLKETFYIAFNPKQVKSATENIGTFDGGNPDIRYSREMDTVKALEKQNALLQERVEYWKRQSSRTREAAADRSEVKRLARRILNSYSSETEMKDIYREMVQLADMSVNAEKADYSKMAETAEVIARKVLEGSGYMIFTGHSISSR